MSPVFEILSYTDLAACHCHYSWQLSRQCTKDVHSCWQHTSTECVQSPDQRKFPSVQLCKFHYVLETLGDVQVIPDGGQFWINLVITSCISLVRMTHKIHKHWTHSTPPPFIKINPQYFCRICFFLFLKILH